MNITERNPTNYLLKVHWDHEETGELGTRSGLDTAACARSVSGLPTPSWWV
jgi:hypothetical protein